MTAIIKKLRRKRKLSSELHSRWGDMSITYPNEGSWSQCEQPPGAVSNAARGQSPMRSWPHGSAESLDRYNHSAPIHGALRSASPEERHSSTDSAATIPTGYYDARVRGRSKRIPPPLGSTSGQRRHSHDSLRDDVLYPGDSTSSAPGGSRGDRLSDEKHHRRARDDADPYSRASRSPPLSVTSRMRRHSAQSSTTEPTPSMPNTASSKHTSLTSSVPSVPMEDIRPAPLAVYHEKKQPRRSKLREADAVVRQELVPSYEDLYG